MKNFTKKITVSFLLALLAVLIFSTSNAQDTKFRDQAWRYGINLGLNANSASLGWQYLYEDSKGLPRTTPDFNKPNNNTKDNTNGQGYGVYAGIFLEYLSESWWGVQIRASWDIRNALVKDIYPMQQPLPTPNTEFDTKMSYLSFEPAIRIDQHFIPNLSITAGPLIAVNIHGTYDYKVDSIAPRPQSTESNIKVTDSPVASLGLTAGLAYDIELSRSPRTSFYLSPFLDYSWIAAQRKSVVTSSQNSSNDIWSTQTFRIGIRLSWEYRNPPEKVTEYITPAPPKIVEAPASKKVFLTYNNTIVTKNVNGYFPIHPYVFFDKGNQEIPSRYVMLSKADAQNFKETDLENFRKGDLTVKETNVNQLMSTYYNILNIYGYRMKMNPNEQLTLSGCDPENKDGEACANKVKSYLVNNFGIEPNRIKIVIESPQKPSGSAYTDPAFSGLINDENRRVGFVFSNQDMYKPVPYTIRDESSIDNDMIFSIADNVQYKSWNITITGENKTMNFGPFKFNSERVNPAPLMRGLDKGKFNAKVVITMQDGKQVSEDFDITLIKEKEFKNASRYLYIFDYNKSDPVMFYETKIRKEITPGMNEGNKVIIHGHTDIIGNEAANQKLSQERAEEAKRIVDDQLGKENKKIDVQAIGIGQTNMQYTFDNKYPEGRMYNRNVFVEVIQ
jgi:outer membrane protein OmpA-like peptidoglycan-associated protein